MRRQAFHIFIRHLLACLLLLLLLHPETPHADADDAPNEYSKGCAHLRCENGARCIKRRFWCNNPPCPGMLFCSKSRKETLKGPSTCDTVRCNQGHVCVIKVRGCSWNTTCRQQMARCISEREYYEGEASCVGFECPAEKRCILRESHCLSPPCKLIRSCAEVSDVQFWLDHCKSLNCTSEYECFLRRPDSSCERCAHTPDCTFTTEDELISKYCRGWTCPRAHKCAVRVVGVCKGINCTIERSCRRASSNSSAARANDEAANQIPISRISTEVESKMLQETENQTPTSHTATQEEGAILATQSTRHPASLNETDVPQQQWRVSVVAPTTESNLIAGSSANPPYSTIRSRTNHDEPSTSGGGDDDDDDDDDNDDGGGDDDDDDENVRHADSSRSSISVTTLSGDDRRTEPSASRDDAPKKLLVASDDALPTLEDVNLVKQSYPIRMPAYPSEVKGENAGAGWEFHAPQEPHRILIPPYEPVFVAEDAHRRGQSLPFFTYAFDYASFDEAVFMSLPEMAARDVIEDSKADDSPRIADEAANRANDSSTAVKTESSETTHLDGSTGDNYANSLTTAKSADTPPSNIRDKELDNYYDMMEE